ncbi:protein kinase [Streptomyces sp. NPDC052396]|uniref:protein kinase n=1 Tax=Streptomyces sp. NPDC052396 TaxID=3365689 RepID=UPI0037D113FE
MDDYAGRVLADRYRLPRPPSDAFELVETRAFDTYSGQEVLVRQIPLPEVVDAELVDGPGENGARPEAASPGRTVVGPGDPAVRRALAAATAAARIPDHPRLDQVFHVFAEAGSLWIVSELVCARPLAAVLAERALSPHRAAEVAADILTALRALHAQGWTHRNITTRTVLICEDGRAILTGLAAGAAEEALCGYDPVPPVTAEAPSGAAGPAGTAGVARVPVQAAGGAPGSRPKPGAIAAYRAGAKAGAARGTLPGPSAGAATWGGGSAASGTAPAPGSPAPQTTRWNADALLKDSASGRNGAQAGVQAGAQPGTQSGAPAGRVAEGWAQTAGSGGALAAERARQARMLVVGPVTERWAPEQAWPLTENWQLAPPVGPAADLWALGALLFRVVQGHAPYPEDNTADLVRLVCEEPPAYAEECGALRPVVESLMRKDPAERPDFEELRGWLRSLIRSAPEPDIGSRTVTVPSTALGTGAAAEAGRLPTVRRRGELMRRRGRTAAGPEAPHGRHKRAGDREPGGERPSAYLQEQRVRAEASPHRLGRLLLGLILLLLVGAVLYALLFMPRATESAGQSTGDRTAATQALSAGPNSPAPEGGAGAASPGASAGGEPAQGVALRHDPKGFTVAVGSDWQRQGDTGRGQVTYVRGDFRLLVVPGRDKVAEFGADPLVYQEEKESELDPFRASAWSGASGLRRVDVGRNAGAQGTFNWTDDSGHQLYVRNAALILDGRYHVLQVIGPASGQRSVDSFFEQATSSYRADG